MIGNEREIINAKCPACQAEVEIELAYVVYPESPELDHLMTGTLNLARCEECQTDFLVETPLLYKDDEDRFLAYYMPVDDTDGQSKAVEELKKLTDVVFANEDSELKPTCRLTFARRRFIEKIMIHD